MKYLWYAITFSVFFVSGFFLCSYTTTCSTLHTKYQTVFIQSKNFLAGTFFAQTIGVEEIKAKYETSTETGKHVRILLVPGHEPNFGGAVFQDILERDMNIVLTQYLAEFLAHDSRFEVIVTRDTESWKEPFAQYFTDHASSTEKFMRTQEKEMSTLIENGKIVQSKTVPHANANKDTALRLYGINAWANEHDISIVLHIHFNDYARNNAGGQGLYSGFSVYVPERQYSNSTSSKVIATTIFERLKTLTAVSNLPIENAGVVEDQDLIAIGRYNTLDVPSVLIEYGYIYEDQFTNSLIRTHILKELAFQTYLGIEDFFESTHDTAYTHNTTLLPYQWKNTLQTGKENNPLDVLALQMALVKEHVYPPHEKTLRECPLSGYFGPCTEDAVSLFQEEHTLAGGDGVVGTKTLKILHTRYAH